MEDAKAATPSEKESEEIVWYEVLAVIIIGNVKLKKVQTETKVNESDGIKVKTRRK